MSLLALAQNPRVRTVDAAYPGSQQPVDATAGSRPRPVHLFRGARLYPGQKPIGLENLPIGADRGHSYRNCAFQILLGIPIFIDFIRSHHRRLVRLGKRKCDVDELAGANVCLSCAMYALAGWYWDPNPQATSEPRKIHALRNLWSLCLATFWGQQTTQGRGIGPRDPDDEYFVDSFLLHFLGEMQRQLAAIPSEHQTFQQIFAIHFALSWRCFHGCGWSAPPHKALQSLYIHADVERPSGKNNATTVHRGIQRAIQRLAVVYSRPSKGSVNERPKCPKCRSLTQAQISILNFPEILIVVRNESELEKHMQADISYASNLHLDLTEFSASQGNRLEQVDAFQSPERTYGLLSGAGEYRRVGQTPRSMAFVKGPSETTLDWFGALDDYIEPLTDLHALEQMQRPFDRDGNKQDVRFFPEVLVFRRHDEAGWRQDYGTGATDIAQPVSPELLDDAQRNRDLVARSVTEIFTKRIGQGLLKFKLKLAPADPGAMEHTAFSLDFGYEYNNCHWSQRIEGRLAPQQGNKKEGAPMYTPWNEDVYARFQKNPQGHIDTSKNLAQHISTIASNEGNQQETNVKLWEAASNPFVAGASIAQPENDMDYELQMPNSFTKSQHIANHLQYQKEKDMRAAWDHITKDNWKIWPTEDPKRNNNNRNKNKSKNKGWGDNSCNHNDGKNDNRGSGGGGRGGWKGRKR